MKIIKIGIFALGILASFTSFSQESPKQKANTKSEKLALELKLDDRQKSLVKEISLVNEFQIEEINSNTELTNEQKLERIKINSKRTQDQIKEILKPEQKEIFNKIGYPENY
jgi:hypothetical protein